MRSRTRTPVLILIAAASLGAAPAVASAQQALTPGGYRNVISANPFTLLLEWFNAEYERVISESSTAGVNGSHLKTEGDRYTNADVFWRFYLGDRTLEGWSFGAKAGITNIPDQGTYFGFGFDMNRNWLMGRNDNFYVGVGFGLKRLVGVPDDADDDDDDDLLRFIPTIRIVNVGLAF